MADRILFDAKIGNWVCIKKGIIDQDTEAMEVARLLASIHDSMDRKIWEFVGKEINTEELDKIAYEITGATYNEKKKSWELKGRKTEQQIASALAKLNSPATTRKINVKGKQALEIAKAYLTRKVLTLLGFRIELDPKIAEKYIEEKSKLA